MDLSQQEYALVIYADSWTEFGEMIIAAAADGMALHSWQVVPAHKVVAVFYPANEKGMQLRMDAIARQNKNA